jgi:hypothetical protein
VKVEALRDVRRPEDLHWIGGHRGRRWNLGQGPTVVPAKSERAVWVSIDLVALLVDRAVVAPTEQGEVRERGRAALRPVTEMMPPG